MLTLACWWERKYEFSTDKNIEKLIWTNLTCDVYHTLKDLSKKSKSLAYGSCGQASDFAIVSFVCSGCFDWVQSTQFLDPHRMGVIIRASVWPWCRHRTYFWWQTSLIRRKARRVSEKKPRTGCETHTHTHTSIHWYM